MGNRVAVQEAEEMIRREEVDIIFLKMFEDLAKAALMGAASCTGAIFDLSANYIEKPAFDSLRKFYDLYFAQGDIDQKKDQVNANLSDMFEYFKNKMESGENIDQGAGFKEDEEIKLQRLSLSGVQKQLEGLIVLDNGIREQILPALASMQFEDSIRQRVGHVVQAWCKIGEILHQRPKPEEIAELAKHIAQILSSVDETKSFYELVLNEKPPEGHDQRSIFIEF